MEEAKMLSLTQNLRRQHGQSVVEYAVVLALVAILTVTVIKGIGQHTAARIAQANDALDQHSNGNGPHGAGGGGGGGGPVHP